MELVDARKKARYSQEAVAGLLGISRPTYAKMESNPDSVTIEDAKNWQNFSACVWLIFFSAATIVKPIDRRETMTTKSHQPEFVAEIIGKTLDHLIDDRKRVAVDFELAENGCMEETHGSLKRRIEAMWGFQTSGIELLEASTTWFELGGMQFNVYSSVQFSVNGKGWSTDFKTIARDTAYDEKE